MKSCNNCLYKRKGDCFGEPKICPDYKCAPNMSEEEKEYWPTIMRSNNQARYAEHKRKQAIYEKIAEEKRNKQPK